MIRYRCEPMNALISKEQCKTNRHMKDNLTIGVLKDWRCKSCAGLGEAVSINVGGLVDMSTKKCSIDGCKSLAQGGCGGMCKAHFHGKAPRVFKRQPPVVAVEDLKVDVVDGSGLMQPVVVTADEVTNVDYIAYLRLLFDEKFEECVSALNNTKTPRDRARCYLSVCDSVEGLGF